MTNQELYINGQLVDMPQNFGVRINRALINPAELNAKDAQMSYAITLPPTGRNSTVFKGADIEETKDKFNRRYTAQLIIDGVRVFDGMFRPSNISGRTGIKGNLYIPDRKSIKDIFGDLKLTDNAPLKIPFTDFVPSVNGYNEAALLAPQPAIFPYVLYGVLPKVPLDKNANNYSPRTVWDSSVRIGIQDLPPSINPLNMLRHIFETQGYNLQGTAFDDDRLTRLYQSYRNPTDYVQPWNYGQHAKIHVRGEWSTRYNKRTGGEVFERGVNQGQSFGTTYGTDFLDATNTKLEILEDKGGNVLYKEVNDGDGVTWVNGQIRVPASGFYKVQFGASVHVFDWEDWRHTDPATGVQHMGGVTSNARNWLIDNMYEIRLCRDRNSGADFGLGSPKLNGVFYYDNQPQNTIFDEQNTPKYFPRVGADGQTNLVDIAQDKAHLLGFGWGNHAAAQDSLEYRNPRDTGNLWAQIIAAKPAQSWDAASATDDPTRLAIQSSGWWKYGRIGSFDNEGDNPDVNVDYSGGPFANGKVLDANGNPQDPNLANLSVRIPEYALNSLTGFQTPNIDWEVSDFLDLALYDNLRFSGTYTDIGDGLAIVAYYDINLQYIGFGLLAPTAGSPPVTYTNEPIVGPPDAAFVRIAGEVDSPVSINADSSASGNIILHRFELQRYFTYVLTAPVGHSGYVYLHNGDDVTPVERIDFVNGVATFNTSLAPLVVFEPRITLYLKTPDYDINGVLIISRKIEESSADVVDWELTNKYAINLLNAPANYSRRGQYDGVAQDANWYAQGQSAAVVWLNAGELLTVASVSSEGRYRRSGMHSTFGWVAHEVKFDLSIQPFRTDKNWLKVSMSGNGTGAMDWNDQPNFATDYIDLVQFLYTDMKTDEYIDNFVKAFNLKLSQIDTRTFSLDLKQTRQSVSSLAINLDDVADVRDRENNPLGLPSLYKIGFTVNTEEQGFVESQDDGGGTFSTGAIEENIVEQKSTFSYNWFKNITQGAAILELPIISKSDVWDPIMSYPDAMDKRYTDLAMRFWYFDGLLGGTFQFNNEPLLLAKVSNEIEGVNILNYKNARFTLLDNYFTVLINGASHYTEIEAYITPAQYKALNGSILAKFNGDLYYIADLTGYDPTGRNKTKIKLIRRI